MPVPVPVPVLGPVPEPEPGPEREPEREREPEPGPGPEPELDPLPQPLLSQQRQLEPEQQSEPQLQELLTPGSSNYDRASLHTHFDVYSREYSRPPSTAKKTTDRKEDGQGHGAEADLTLDRVSRILAGLEQSITAQLGVVRCLQRWAESAAEGQGDAHAGLHAVADAEVNMPPRPHQPTPRGESPAPAAQVQHGIHEPLQHQPPASADDDLALPTTLIADALDHVRKTSQTTQAFEREPWREDAMRLVGGLSVSGGATAGR